MEKENNDDNIDYKNEKDVYTITKTSPNADHIKNQKSNKCHNNNNVQHRNHDHYNNNDKEKN